MKKLIAILILFYSLTALGQNGVNGDYFLLLNSKSTISLNTFENSAIVEHKTFDITEKSIFTTDKKSRVAILDTAKNAIILYDFQLSNETKLTIPYELKPKTILLFENNLFVGGEMGKEILVQYQIKGNHWEKLEVPEEVQMWGKAVDDLVIKDNLLIAIDDIVMPKYVLFYNLKSAGKLELSHFKKLKSNGTYESIYKGRITKKYLGLLSGTFGGYGSDEHITIYSDTTLLNSFSISTGEGFNDFVIFEDKIIIAHNDYGLGYFDIKPSYFDEPKDRFDIFNPKISSNKIKYNSYKKDRIVSLTIIPDTDKIVLTIKDKHDKIRHEIIEI
ncbi:hypothetical protein [Mangrovibacterium lignilyticum]|uniref:hypothetical protein n=1 Tax=Mangrovibacterium lignilyticum TaxID=2668052 RepID=UPI0013D10D69|nr:hypothetical protein [Mangrovibacterium lignilyticum]